MIGSTQRDAGPEAAQKDYLKSLLKVITECYTFDGFMEKIKRIPGCTDFDLPTLVADSKKLCPVEDISDDTLGYFVALFTLINTHSERLTPEDIDSCLDEGFKQDEFYQVPQLKDMYNQLCCAFRAVRIREQQLQLDTLHKVLLVSLSDIVNKHFKAWQQDGTLKGSLTKGPFFVAVCNLIKFSIIPLIKDTMIEDLRPCSEEEAVTKTEEEAVTKTEDQVSSMCENSTIAPSTSAAAAAGQPVVPTDLFCAQPAAAAVDQGSPKP